MNPAQFRLALLGLALGVLLALIIAPQTRWLVRLQTLSSLRLYHPFPNSTAQPYTSSPAADERHVQAVLARHPDEFAFQYAHAINPEDSAQTVVALRALEARFPDRPTLYAGILRYAASGLHWNRTEENSLYDLPVHSKEFHPVPNSPASLAAFDRESASGERLDPDNAYFAVMRAVGLFAAHRDTEGRAALARAGHETEWREYVPEDVEARQRLHEVAFGDPGAFPRSVAAYSTLFPQYALLRALARLLLYKAMQEELAGHPEQGLRIREQMRHYGDLMRVQSTSAISSLVGIAIAAIATSRPGGAPPPQNEAGLNAEQRAQRRLDAYSTYVTRIGHPEAAARARAEEEAGRNVQALVSLDQLPDLTGPIFQLAAWWLAGLASLANIYWLLVFGGLAAWVARLRRIRQADPLPAGASAGIWATLVLSLAALILLSVDLPEETAATALVAVLFTLFAGIFVVAALQPARRSPLKNAGLSGLVTLAALGLLAVLASWQAQSLADLVTAVNFLTGSSHGDTSDNHPATATSFLTGPLFLALAVPLLMLVVTSIAARVRRVPVSVGLVLTFRRAALPLACLLLLLWGGLLLGTVRQERVVNAQVWHTVHDGGPYLAAGAGHSWPGPVR